MKLVDIYLSYKKKYREYVVLIKSGIFYEVIEDDVGIMYSLFNYKIRKIGNSYNIGFPINNIGFVCNKLEDNKINYIILEKENDNYQITTKKDYKNNNYSKYKIDLIRYSYINKRINRICDRLKNKVFDNDLEKILLKIEGII